MTPNSSELLKGCGMHSQTRKPMSFLTYILTGLLCLTQANGCLLEDFEKAPEPKRHIVYELPPPWIVEMDAMARIGGDPANPGSVPDAKITVSAEKKGIDADAKKLALLSFNNAGDRDFAEPVFSERTIAERKVYLYEGASPWGPHTLLFFEKDGVVFEIVMSSHLKTYEKDIEMLIRTLRWETPKN